MRGFKNYALAGVFAASLTGLGTPQIAAAAPITGTPSCVSGGGDCTVTIAPTTRTLDAGNGFATVFEIVLDNMQHIELIDTDSAGEFVTSSMPINNTTSIDIGVGADVGFSDENGNIIDPPGILSAGGAGIGVGGSIIGLSLTIDTVLTSLIFHDLLYTVDCGACVDPIDVTLNSVRFFNFDPESNVGVWGVPEPSTLAIFGLGLAGLGWLRRRGQAAF